MQALLYIKQKIDCSSINKEYKSQHQLTKICGMLIIRSKGFGRQNTIFRSSKNAEFKILDFAIFAIANMRIFSAFSPNFDVIEF